MKVIVVGDVKRKEFEDKINVSLDKIQLDYFINDIKLSQCVDKDYVFYTALIMYTEKPSFERPMKIKAKAE